MRDPSGPGLALPYRHRQAPRYPSAVDDSVPFAPIEYDENGVDRTLVRACLAMSPADRVRSHEKARRDVEALDLAGRRMRGEP